MKKQNRNEEAFFALLRAGLWEQSVNLSTYYPLDFSSILALAEEQSVVGIVAAGLEYVEDKKLKKQEVMPFIGQALHLEQRNLAMNDFIRALTERMREEGIYALLVKGQGIAQCYSRPLWRSSGDIDFLLDKKNYYKAGAFFDLIATRISSDTKKNNDRLNREYSVDGWTVELHGTLHANLSRRMDRVIDIIQDDVFSLGEVRSWRNETTDIFLPSANNDIIFVFSHILQHFFLGGVGFRQLCDLCRLLWTYKNCIDRDLLRIRLTKMKIMSEWMAFSTVLVRYLGMPETAVPLYGDLKEKKADLLVSIMMQTGNFGRNNDYSYFQKYPRLFRKLITFTRQFRYSLELSSVFPVDAPRFLLRFVFDGTLSAFAKE